jgi:hypothetical protein
MTPEEISSMLNSRKLILKGKRWRKFNEFTLVPIFVTLAVIIGCTLRISKVGFTEWQMVPFLIVPILFLVLWIPYKNTELQFFEVFTPFEKKENYHIAMNALKKMNWSVKIDTESFLEAYTSPAIGFTWGSDMITVLTDDKRILINCICNIDIVKQQAFFTFGKLKRNVNRLAIAIEEEVNTYPAV